MRNFLQMISLTFAFSQLEVITLMAHSKSRGPCGSSIPVSAGQRNIITWMFGYRYDDTIYSEDRVLRAF